METRTAPKLFPLVLEPPILLKLLGGLGAVLTFLGAFSSLVSGALIPTTLHSQYGSEHVFVIFLACVAAVATQQNRLRVLGYIGVGLVATGLLCVSTEIKERLVHATPRPGENGLDALTLAAREGVAALWQSHVGWSFLLFATAVFAYVGNRAGSYAYYVDMEKRKAFKQGQGISKRDEVLAEIVKAPLWPLAYGSVLILSGILILFAGGEVSLGRKLIGALVSEFGFAFFIAYVLSISLEIHAKREHDRQMSRGLLSVVYGFNLDKNLFSDTERHIFKSPFYRRDTAVEYDFLKVVGEWMLVKYVLTYTIENVSTGTASFAVDGFVEKVPDHPELLDGKMKFGLTKIYVDGSPLTPVQMKRARDQVADDEKYVRSRHMVSLRPGQKKQIRTVHLTARMTRDSELWRSLICCASLEIKIRWSKDIRLVMFAEAVHPNGDFDFRDRDERSLYATINRPLFPQNGFYLWWWPEGSAPGKAVGAEAGLAAAAAPLLDEELLDDSAEITPAWREALGRARAAMGRLKSRKASGTVTGDGG